MKNKYLLIAMFAVMPFLGCEFFNPNMVEVSDILPSVKDIVIRHDALVKEKSDDDKYTEAKKKVYLRSSEMLLKVLEDSKEN